MLVNRWGILRRAIPATVGLVKTTSLVCSLCILHNYCIDQRLMSQQGPLSPEDANEDMPPSTEADNLELLSVGAIPLERNPNGLNNYSPEQLMHGGEHFDNLPRDVRRRISNWELAVANGDFPRDVLYNIIVEKGLKRPTPVRWQK